ncbi:MAG TPA: biopolymer transporter ExbD [Pyrinomonadaceae bacterium]|nr:biopolymer transporter ExbD [Pyrinomonadaceae bacterium]
MGMGGNTSEEYNSEINVTPMVDIMLVLLIIFMVVTPLLQQGVSVNLPRDMIGPVEDPDIIKETSVLISIPNNTEFYIGKDKYAKEVMGDKIKKLMEGKTPDKRIVYIKSGVDVGYGTVVEAINIIRKQDVDKIGLVADRKKGQQQAKQQ